VPRSGPVLADVPYDDHLRAVLAERLAAHQVREHERAGLRHAAVALVVVDSDAVLHGTDPDPGWPDGGDWSKVPGVRPGEVIDGDVSGTAGGPAIILTRRGRGMRTHSYQWAIPGGRLDDGESAVAAALRELAEELGLVLGEDALLGRLDDYTTRSGYVISPFVFWGGADPSLTPDPHEVHSVHRISFRELLRPDGPRFVSIPESDRPVVQIPIGRDLVHAPTGAVLLQFRRVALEGVSERVDGYDQPVFAWR
jgi:8-oxo-dGTP pyrophosphatase MutT (NUDIX family)